MESVGPAVVPHFGTASGRGRGRGWSRSAVGKEGSRGRGRSSGELGKETTASCGSGSEAFLVGRVEMGLEVENGPVRDWFAAPFLEIFSKETSPF